IIICSLRQERGADPNTFGRMVRLNGQRFTVVGVAREGFSGTSIPGPEVWLPLGAHDALSGEDGAARALDARDAHALSAVGRLRTSIPVEHTAAALATAGSRLEQAYPSVNGGYSITMSKPGGRLLFIPGPGTGEVTGVAR